MQAVCGEICLAVEFMSFHFNSIFLISWISVKQDKEKVNSGNKYSHNYFGLYCTCDRPYPDPEDKVLCDLV